MVWLAGTFPTEAPVESLTAQAACSRGSIRAATRRVPDFQLGGQSLCVIGLSSRFAVRQKLIGRLGQCFLFLTRNPDAVPYPFDTHALGDRSQRPV